MAEARGVYGIRMEGLDASRRLLAEVAPAAPTLRIERRPVAEWSVYGEPFHVDDLVDGGRAGLFVDQDLALLDLHGDVPDDEIVHPWIVPTICRLSVLLSRVVLHGGVIARDGVAVAVLGDREAGKSTLMGQAALCGGNIAVLADDLVVLDGSTVFAGPRCIDLRLPSIDVLPALKSTPSRDGTRRRVVLPRCASTAELVGFVVLGWGARLELAALPTAMRLPALLPHMSAGQSRESFEQVLSLARLPVWTLARPKDPALLSAALSLLLTCHARSGVLI